ncbi:MAG: DsbA family protein [Geminicoccaceae bacterium]|nr:DsbA family protein [Geminicoccaceae bacterium]
MTKVEIMRQRFVTWMIAAAIAGAAIMQDAGRAAAQDPVSGLTTGQIEQIVRDYLLREPEVIYEALQVFQERQKSAEAARQKEIVAEKSDEIFNDDRDAEVNPDGDVTLVEFFDYRCGYCRRMTEGLRSLVGDDTGIRLVFKEFPILGEDSMRASKAALAAKRQGAYDGFHAALMTASDMSMEAIERLADHYELDFDKLAEDMESEEVAAQISDTLRLGHTLGISGTPSFIIGETVIPGAIPVDQLAELVEQHR